MNFVPSIGSKPEKLTPEQEKELNRHFRHELSRQVGIEPTLFGYAAVAMIAVVGLFFWLVFKEGVEEMNKDKIENTTEQANEVEWVSEVKMLDDDAVKELAEAVGDMPWPFRCPEGTFNATVDHNIDTVVVTPEIDNDVNRYFATKLKTLMEGFLKELPKEHWIDVNFEVKKHEKSKTED